MRIIRKRHIRITAETLFIRDIRHCRKITDQTVKRLKKQRSLISNFKAVICLNTYTGASRISIIHICIFSRPNQPAAKLLQTDFFNYYFFLSSVIFDRQKTFRSNTNRYPSCSSLLGSKLTTLFTLNHASCSTFTPQRMAEQIYRLIGTHSPSIIVFIKCPCINRNQNTNFKRDV